VNSQEFNNHIIYLNLRSLSDHALLSITISIEEKYIQDKKQMIVKNSKEEAKFVKELISKFGSINTSCILNCNSLENIA